MIPRLLFKRLESEKDEDVRKSLTDALAKLK